MKRLSFFALAVFFIISLQSFSPDTYPQAQDAKASWNFAFSPGEKLKYRVHYGVLNAATITMEVAPEITKQQDRNTWKIKGSGNTNSGYDWFFKVRDTYESFIDCQSLLPVQYVRNVQEGGYKDVEVATFKQQEGKIYSSKGTISTPFHSFQDVLSSIYYLRNVDFSKLKKGDVLKLNFYLDKLVYETYIRYDGLETIQTDLGKFRAIKLKPKVLVDRVFPKEDAMTIWASDDWNHIPLKVQSELKIGSLKADLTQASGLRYEMKARISK